MSDQMKAIRALGEGMARGGPRLIEFNPRDHIVTREDFGEFCRAFHAAAIAAERERCAKLCEDHDKDCAAEGREHNAIEIAAAIRNQEKKG